MISAIIISRFYEEEIGQYTLQELNKNIKTPVSGIIKESNISLLKNPGLINKSPYSEGWVYRIEPSNWAGESKLLVLWEKYRELLYDEFTRLKEFISTTVKPEAMHARVMQDGGELYDCILQDLGPEVWEDFQTRFLDCSI